jgi:hypothetical protein
VQQQEVLVLEDMVELVEHPIHLAVANALVKLELVELVEMQKEEMRLEEMVELVEMQKEVMRLEEMVELVEMQKEVMRLEEMVELVEKH